MELTISHCCQTRPDPTRPIDIVQNVESFSSVGRWVFADLTETWPATKMSSGHVTNNVTWPQKVGARIPLRLHVSITMSDEHSQCDVGNIVFYDFCWFRCVSLWMPPLTRVWTAALYIYDNQWLHRQRPVHADTALFTVLRLFTSTRVWLVVSSLWILAWLIGAAVCLLAAPRVQLFAVAGNGWPHSALRYH